MTASVRHTNGEVDGHCRDCAESVPVLTLCSSAEPADEEALRGLCAWCGHAVEEVP